MNRESGKAALVKAGMSEKKATELEKKLYKLAKNDDDYRWYVYQKVGEVLQNDVEKEVKVGFEARCYDNIRSKLAEFDDYLENPFEVEDGVQECPKCHSKKTFSTTKQCRGADESATTFSRCVGCNFTWTYSG